MSSIHDTTKKIGTSKPPLDSLSSCRYSNYELIPFQPRALFASLPDIDWSRRDEVRIKPLLRFRTFELLVGGESTRRLTDLLTD